MSTFTSLLNSNKSQLYATPETLDQLWAKAEQLGKIEVDHAFGSKAYRVRIMFSRKSGSTVWAEAQDMTIALAISKAIEEALSLGAKP